MGYSYGSGSGFLGRTKWLWIGLGVFTFLVIVVGMVGRYTFLGYYWHAISDQEIGVETIAGNVSGVKPPGVHSNGHAWADLWDVNVAQLPWCAVDPEVLTRDSQRLGFVVCGTVQRPGLVDHVEFPVGSGNLYTFYEVNNGQNWVAHKHYYTDDALLAGRYHQEASPDGREQIYIVDKAGLMQQLAQQAMKSCVGDRDFKEAVVGSARDELRTCIDANISTLAENYGGLKVQNVVVPNVILEPGVQVKLDEITASKFNTELALQEAERAKAEAETELAKKQGEIRVREGTAQEEARQKATTAELQARAEEAREDLIRAQKANQRLEAELDLQVAEIKLQAAKLEARQTHAWDIILSELLAEYPEYAEYLMLKAAIEGWKNLDKVIVPAGTDPLVILDPWGNSETPILVVPPEE